jgi:hypothetical protein
MIFCKVYSKNSLPNYSQKTTHLNRKKIMIYRILFIGLVSVLFASLTINVIHSESLDVARETIEIDNEFQRTVIGNLHDRVIELEN